MRLEGARDTLLRRMWKARAAYVFISPFYLMFLAFTVFPIGYSFYLSLTKPLEGVNNFVGLANYANIIRDPRFWRALHNNVMVVIVQVPVMLTLATVLATALNSKVLPFRKFFRTAYFLPVVMSLVVSALSFSMILNRDIGLLNLVLRKLGLATRDWLNDANLSLLSIMAIMTWRWTGYNMVIILAGLQNIPRDLLEAAEIDGASSFQRFWHLTLPLLWPVIFFCLVVSVIGSFQLFEEPSVLTMNTGAPMDTTLTLALYLYQQAFMTYRLGYGSAIAYCMVIIMVVASVLQLRFLGGQRYAER